MNAYNKPILILLGGGGHAMAVAEVVRAENAYTLTGYIDFEPHPAMTTYCNYLGDYSEIPALLACNTETFAIVAIGSNRIRQEESLRWPGLKWATVVHPTGYISPSARLSEGTVVMPKAVVHTMSTIGKHAIINTASVVEHESTIGDYCHIGPGAVTGAGVLLGDSCFIGLNSTILPFVTLPDRTILGAGSTLLKTPALEGTYVGCPAKRLP